MTKPREQLPTNQDTRIPPVSVFKRVIPVTVRGGVSAVIALAGVIAIFLGITLMLFIQELSGFAYTVLAVGGILTLAALMISFAAVRETITGRRGRYSTNTLIMIVAFVTLIVLVDVVTIRNSVRWDTTATRQFSLAPQTLDILEDLTDHVRVTAFFVESDLEQELYRVPSENLLNEFRHRSKGDFDYRFVNPDLQPTLARQYGITEYPTVVFESENRGLQYNLTAPLFQERDFTSAILIVTGVQRKKIYYLEGFNGLSFQDFERDSHVGFGYAASGMAGDNYAVLRLSLAETPAIPEDATAVAIASPQREITDEEASIIHNYLRSGGRLLLLLEPAPPQTFKDLLAKWAITVNEGTIVDLASSLAGQSQTPLIKREQYITNPPIDAITAPLDQGYFPGATSFEPSLPPEEMPSYIAHYPIARTTLLSCLTSDPSVQDCSGKDFVFQIPAMAIQAVAPLNEAPDPNAARETRIVIFGDADFATNFHLSSLSNRDLLLNSVNWLTEDISLASVRPKPITFRRLVVTTREMQLIRALSWFVLPGTMVLLAGLAWWRRR
ncbi:GldG family protein [Dehalococcoidia bacterium]|nr:GldG family protein [Dehalococcoidia bacterium]